MCVRLKERNFPNMINIPRLPLVCHFLIDYRVGGPHKYVEVCAEYMAEEYESLVFTCGKSKIESVALFNLRRISRYLYPFEVALNTIYIVFLGCYYKRVGRTVIFNIHGVHNIAPVLAACILRVSSVLLIHESMRELRILAKVALFFLRINSGIVISVSNNGLNMFGVKDGVVVDSPVDVGYWKEKADIRMSNLEVGRLKEVKKKLLFVGNLNPIKGLGSLLDGLADLKRPVTLNIIGASMGSHSSYYDELQEKTRIALAKNENLEINYLGWQQTGTIRDYLREADLLVMPSVSEGCPIALIEALATGCIPFVTDVGDVAEILSNVLPEAICSGFDSNSLHVGIEHLLNKIDKLSQEEVSLLRKQLIEVAEQRFDVSIVASKIMNLYKVVENR